MSDARLPSLPSGPPSSSAGKSSDSGKSGEFIGGSDREGMVDRAAFSRALTQARPLHLGGTRRTYATRAHRRRRLSPGRRPSPRRKPIPAWTAALLHGLPRERRRHTSGTVATSACISAGRDRRASRPDSGGALRWPPHRETTEHRQREAGAGYKTRCPNNNYTLNHSDFSHVSRHGTTTIAASLW